MSDSEFVDEYPSDFFEDGLVDGKDRKLSVRFPEYHYKALKAYSTSSGKSMNKVIIDAVADFCSGFFHVFAHDNEISKGVDKYIYQLLGVEEVLPFYENPVKSNKEIFSLLGVNTHEQLSTAFNENINLIIKRAEMVSKRYDGSVKKMPIGIGMHYLIFVLVAKEVSPEKSERLMDLCFMGYSDVVDDVNCMRSMLGLELIL